MRFVAVLLASVLFFGTVAAFFVVPALAERRAKEALGDEDVYVTDTARAPWLYVDENGTATILADKCGGRDEIVIPEVLNGITVTSFNMENYIKPLHIKKITFPKTLRKMEEYPFIGWASLEEAVFQEGIEDLSKMYIGPKDTLQKIVFPKTLKELRHNVLKDANPSLVVCFRGTEEEWLSIGKAAQTISSKYTMVYEYRD